MFREADEDESGFMCCAFSARERFLMLGTCTGQLKLYNVFTGQEEASYSCHSSAITHLEPSRVSRENHKIKKYIYIQFKIHTDHHIMIKLRAIYYGLETCVMLLCLTY